MSAGRLQHQTHTDYCKYMWQSMIKIFCCNLLGITIYFALKGKDLVFLGNVKKSKTHHIHLLVVANTTMIMSKYKPYHHLPAWTKSSTLAK